MRILSINEGQLRYLVSESVKNILNETQIDGDFYYEDEDGYDMGYGDDDMTDDEYYDMMDIENQLYNYDDEDIDYDKIYGEEYD